MFYNYEVQKYYEDMYYKFIWLMKVLVKDYNVEFPKNNSVVLVFQMHNKLLIGNSNVLYCHNNVLYVLKMRIVVQLL